MKQNMGYLTKITQKTSKNGHEVSLSKHRDSHIEGEVGLDFDKKKQTQLDDFELDENQLIFDDLDDDVSKVQIENRNTEQKESQIFDSQEQELHAQKSAKRKYKPRKNVRQSGSKRIVDNVTVRKAAQERPFSNSSFSEMASEIYESTKHLEEDPSYRNITEKQLDQLIPLLREYQNKRQKGDNNRLSMQQIADTVKLSKSNVSRLYEQFIEDPFLSRKRLSIQYNKTCRSTPTSSKNQMRIFYLKKIVENNCMLSIVEIAKVMCNIPALVAMSRPERPASGPIVKKLLKKLGYLKKVIRKVPPTSNSPSCLQMRKIYCAYYKKKNEEGHEFNFFGITDFHYLMYRNRGWAYKEQPPQINSNDPKKIVSLQCIIAPSGMLAKVLKCGGFTKEDFTSFLVDFLRSGRREGKKKFLVMDSSMMKHRAQIEQIAAGFATKFEVIYLPPESPLINPLEGIFLKLRNQIMVKKFTNNKDLEVFLHEQLSRYELQSLARYFEEVDVYIKLGIQGKEM